MLALAPSPLKKEKEKEKRKTRCCLFSVITQKPKKKKFEKVKSVDEREIDNCRRPSRPEGEK